jgi:hypothetical protein
MSLGTRVLQQALVSKIKTLGVCGNVAAYPPIAGPGPGVTAWLWVQRVVAVPSLSGLANTAARVDFTLQLLTSTKQSPYEGIDEKMADALDVIMRALVGDFTLTARIHSVDVLGAYGAPVTAELGWVDFDRVPWRALTVTIPLVVTDLWDEVA